MADKDTALAARTYHYHALSNEALATGFSGLEFMRAQMQGKVPRVPMFDTLGIKLTAVEPGHITLHASPEPWLINTLGTMHGGFAASLLDTSMGCAVHTIVPAGSSYATVDLTINYIRPMTLAMDHVIVTGDVIHPGRRMATAEGRITTPDGKLLAHGTTTCMLLAPTDGG